MIYEQLSFSSLRWPAARLSNLQLLLDRIDLAVDFSPLADELSPHFPGPGRGRRPWPLNAMIRIVVAGIVLKLNPRQLEDLLIDHPGLCEWCGLDDSQPRPPDSETIAAFIRKLAKMGREDAIPAHLTRQLSDWNLRLVPGSSIEPRLHGREL
ncbi:transposase [Candidatus Accumulibacter sp. ACC007]|uniref:transposase n=1 Tax=Candidatus Accumulibacter sp. ACC007 TaxID=2823333 RepID=UPI0025C5CBC8|nr:transposase [Candidatus Accumulibacter sp. ACC007]